MPRTAMSEMSLALVAVLLAAGPGAAQTGGGTVASELADSVPRHRSPWVRAGLAAAGTVIVFLADQPVNRFVQDHRSTGLDALADGARQGGQWQFHIALPVALAVTGVVVGEARVVHAGVDVAAATIASGLVVSVLKNGLGRQRPLCVCGAFDFDPLGSGKSLPSGHTAAAFAAATALAGHVERPWMRAGLYGAATLVAWSRLNDDKHWLSDVVAGAFLGIATARITRGRLGGPGGLQPTVARRGEWTSIGVMATF